MPYINQINVGGVLYDVQDLEASTAVPQIKQMISNVESSPATAAHAAGSYLIYNNTLCRASADIAVGDALTVGTNIAAVSGGLSGDVADLKSAMNDITETYFFGEIATAKADLVATYGKYTEDKLYRMNGVVDGTTTFSQLINSQSSGAYTVKIPIDTAKSIKYPVFKTSSDYGSVIIDENNVILAHYYETSENTGAYHTLNVPDGSKYLVLSVSASLSALDWSVTLFNDGYEDIKEDVKELDSRVANIENNGVKRIAKSEVSTFYETGYLYNVNPGVITIGTTTCNNVPKSSSSGAKTVKIPLTGIKELTYPMFKTSGYSGSFMCDENDVVIWAYYNTTKDTGAYKTISIPPNAKYFILSISQTLYATSWYYEISSKIRIPSPTPFEDANRNLCLAGIKTDILTNKIPYHRGFLFHKMENDNSLWYGTTFENAVQFAIAEFDVTQMRFAISPKDGRIIAAQRDARNGIWVFDGENTTHLNSFTTNPMAWLYNSGVDFIVDGSGNEHCIFAEYHGSPSSGTTFYVWRGTYPYTSASDWEIVMTQTYSNIMHFHMVRRDPWSNVLYLTSGDSNAQCSWWYSDNYGETWETLTTGATSGYPDQVCRTINFVFTKDWIYWATDHGTNHMLCKVSRDENGLIDVSSRVKLCDLPDGYATNSICYVESPNGIFMYDRVDTGYTSQYGDPVTMKFWDIEAEELVDIVTLGLTSNTWGGSRGKCYVNYTNGKEVKPAMGFSIDTPCIFDLVCDNPANIGTIAYDIGSKTVSEIEY